MREHKKQQRRQRILQAAIEAFSVKGLAATAMQDIADRTGFAVGTIYNYFPSKNALLLGILEEQMKDIRRGDPREMVQLLRTEPTAAAVLDQVIGSNLKRAFSLSKENWRELLSALFTAQEELQEAIRFDMELISLLTGLCRQLQRRGMARREVAPKTMATNLYSIVSVQFLMYVYVPEMEPASLGAEISRQIELAVQGIGPGNGKEE